MGGFRGNVKVASPPNAECSDILTPEAIDFVSQLAQRFQPSLEQLLAKRVKVQAEFDAGKKLDFNPHTQDIRDKDWKVGLRSAYTGTPHTCSNETQAVFRETSDPNLLPCESFVNETMDVYRTGE